MTVAASAANTTTLDYNFNGFTAEDDPLVADTGTGPGDVDRGAVERTDPMTVHVSLSASQAPTGGTVTATLSSTAGWTPIAHYDVDFGDGAGPRTTTASTVQDAYTTTGFHGTTVTVSDSFGYLSGPATAGITVVPPAALTPRTTVRTGGTLVTVDGTASTDSLEHRRHHLRLRRRVHTGRLAAGDLCPRLRAQRPYRVTFTLTDAGGNTAATSTVVTIGPVALKPPATPPVIVRGHCAVCRGAAPGAVSKNLPPATNPAVVRPGVPALRPSASRLIAPRRHNCLPRAACAATAV